MRVVSLDMCMHVVSADMSTMEEATDWPILMQAGRHAVPPGAPREGPGAEASRAAPQTRGWPGQVVHAPARPEAAARAAAEARPRSSHCAADR